VHALPALRVIGPLQLSSESVKASLFQEIANWKQIYGAHINKRALQANDELALFFDKTLMKLNRKVFLLDEASNLRCFRPSKI